MNKKLEKLIQNNLSMIEDVQESTEGLKMCPISSISDKKSQLGGIDSPRGTSKIQLEIENAKLKAQLKQAKIFCNLKEKVIQKQKLKIIKL